MCQTFIASMDVVEGCDTVEVVNGGFDAVQDVVAFFERNMWNFGSIDTDFNDVVVIFKEISMIFCLS